MTSRWKCLRCNSDRIVLGRLKSSEGVPWFSLAEAGGITLTRLLSSFTRGGSNIPLLTFAYVCIDCGLLWSDVELETAKEKIEVWGSDSLKERLRTSYELDQVLDEIEFEDE